MAEWWNPKTYLGLESLLTERGLTPLNLALSGSGATNTLHALSDVDIFGTYNETGPTLLFSQKEVADFLGLVDPPSIRMVVRDRPTNLLKLSSDFGSKCRKIWELERILLYPKIYEDPTLTPAWKVVASSLLKKRVGEWYLQASYERIPLFDDTSYQTCTLLNVQMALRLSLSGAHYLENASFLVDAKALFTWAGIAFDWDLYWMDALSPFPITLYISQIENARNRLASDVAALP